MVPVLSVLLSLWLLDERPSLAEGGGIALILLALALLGAVGMRSSATRAMRRRS
jgi:drug/metabolite transporter (DMT)-like permease